MNIDYKSVGKVKDFKVLLCERKEIAEFIETIHYSKNVNGLKTDYCFKLLDSNNVMIGAMIYGKLGMANVWKKYTDAEYKLTELKRLCCINNTPKNTESYFIGATLRWLKKHSKIEKVLSYADKTYGHEGVIYKASNFKFVGITSKCRVIMYNNKLYHDKTIRTKYKGNLKPFAQKIKDALDSGDAYYKQTLEKNIFLYFLHKKTCYNE